MLRNYLPQAVVRELFGDRRRYGTRVQPDDPDWQRWLELFPEIYQATQRPGSLEARLNATGYRVLKGLDTTGLKLCELGPGGGYHLRALEGAPASYTALDVTDTFFPRLEQAMTARGTAFQGLRLDRPDLPLETHSQDLCLSFYSLEHVDPLESWIDELMRVLRPGGRLVGAIPAEGGLAWGLGRWLTSRRTFQKKYGLDLLKIICWSHPNLCDTITASLRRRGAYQERRWPLPFLGYDFNLVIRFTLVKP
ncbi:MAG: hypothetical protein AMXMBFR33_66000 [Candidatus Xenobia bacterium]